MSILFEGQMVQWVGDDTPAKGHIIAIAGRDSVHVKWSSGPDAGAITLSNIYDLDTYTASAEPQPDPFHFMAVRNAYDESAETGVLNFLASNKYLGSWERIAKDVLGFVEDRIKVDASMELVDEQLSPQEKQSVVRVAALALLRDAFTVDEE